MRKILIILLIVLLLVLGYFTIFNGLNIFGMEILSVFAIKDKSEQLDGELQKISTLTSVDRTKAMSDLNDSAKQLVIAKEEYNDKILYSSKEEIEIATQGIQYEMEYLWTKIGNHATKNGIILKFVVSQSASGAQNQYDLSFVATGRYVSISEFIAALENDSSLNFKIENAKVSPFEGSTENLQASFEVKEISIRIDKVTKTPTNNNLETDRQNNTVTQNNAPIDEKGGNS
ncbi:MAG: hypothetical protein HFJ26_05875 [Clostridia bacterium]|nr:hypothetical protein [Clostridia bacterium]